MKNGEVLERVKEERHVVLTIKRKKDNWIGHLLCRKCLVRHVIEGNIEERREVTGRRGRRRRKMTLQKDTGN